MASTLRRLWKNEYFKTAIAVLLIAIGVFGFWFGAETVLGTSDPALAVASGSMCLVQPNRCDGWSHPFERTLHKGDLIIIQGVSLESIYAHPENGDIVVYRRESDNELIVHRAVGKQMIGNEMFLITKGDANGPEDAPVPSGNVMGRVVLRIPWVGWLALFMRDSSAVYIIVIIIILLIIVEFAIPSHRTGKIETEPGTTDESVAET